MHSRARLLAATLWAIALMGCPEPDPDPDPPDASADAALLDATLDPDRGLEDATVDAQPADAATPDAMTDAATPDAVVPDALPPDAGAPPAIGTTLELCVGCGAARSADYRAVQRVVPFSTRRAASADFTMELLTAPQPTEANR